VSYCDSPPMSVKRVIALLATFNEERFIEGCLDHLIHQGVDVYIIDNSSTDATVQIAKRFQRRGLLGLERIPRESVFDLGNLLVRKEELAASLDADWFMHHDADEIRLAPGRDRTMLEAISEVDSQGYNAVNFMEFTFVPTREQPNHDHPHFRKTMRWYYPFTPRFPHHVKLWKRQPGPVGLADSAGHRVSFPDLRLAPESFVMKHYQFLSVEHAARKYERRYNPEALRKGWHHQRDKFRVDRVVLPSQDELHEFVDDDHLDTSSPRRTHILFEHQPLNPRVRKRGRHWRRWWRRGVGKLRRLRTVWVRG
jgi:Glycosyl transferase family 2